MLGSIVASGRLSTATISTISWLIEGLQPLNCDTYNTNSPWILRVCQAELHCLLDDAALMLRAIPCQCS